MRAGHTPAPWEMVGTRVIRGPFFPGDPDRPGLEVATVPLWSDRADADARLIAAAPDLLAALHRLITVMPSNASDDDDPEQAAAWAAAMAVIEQAVGK